MKLQKKKYKLKYNIILRNISIILLLTLIILYINLMDHNTNTNIKKVQDFTDYAKTTGLTLTQSNYSDFIK